MSQKVNTNDINYLAFEGGGGKGIVYLGVVQALEEKYMQKNFAGIDSSKTEYPGRYDDVKARGSLPLFPIWSSHPKHRPLKGISGSSAGAITAFLLAMGLSSKDIEWELNKTTREDIAGEPTIISKTEKFLEKPNSWEYRASSGKKEHKNHENMLEKFKAWAARLKFLGGNIGIESLLEKTKQSESLIKKILLLSDYRHAPLSYRSKSSGKKELLRYSLNPTARYLHSLIYNRGLFAGFEIRKYLEELMNEYLFKKGVPLSPQAEEGAGFVTEYIPAKPSEITFKWFYKITGVDLVITGVNVTQGIPVYFSLTHTPDFPVIEAVAISMNIPIIFRPVYINTRVDFTFAEDGVENMKYYGLYVDGGTTNNFPIHAFNDVVNRSVEYQSEITNLDLVALNEFQQEFQGNTLGFLLESNIAGLQSEISSNATILKYENKSELEAAVFKKDNPDVMKNYLIELLDSLMYHTTKGQINSQLVAERTILIDTGSISMLDFSSPDLDLDRGKEKAYLEKKELIGSAKDIVNELLI